MATVLAAFLCVASGFALASLAVSRVTSLATGLLLRVSISIGYGLGIFSVVFLLCRIFSVTNLITLDGAVFVLLSGFAILCRVRRSPAVSCPPTGIDGRTWLHRLLASAFCVALGVAAYSAVERARAHPHGDGWDAFGIWNLHARFLFLGGAHWRDGFSPLIPWSHPDYPLLLPGAIAHFFSYLGYDDPRVPVVIALLFTFSTIGILFSALAILRGRTPAMLAALALSATPFFIEQGTSQYADIPLSFFVLATIALLCLYDDRSVNSSPSRRLVAGAGFAVSLAAWTKNEGLLFLCAILGARFLTLMRSTILCRPSRPQNETRRESWIAFGILLLSVAPGLFLIAWFKHFAPPGDLFSDSAKSLHRLVDPLRYWAILKWYVKGFLRFGNWSLIPGTLTLIGFYLIAGNKRGRKPDFSFRCSALALLLTLGGYFAIYLITPYDIYWHLRFSLARLFLQLWPSAIFLFFLTVPLSSSQSEA
ncbi:MAG TPA: glycosyltransferase family 39 protein [Candidatus Sulfotelmatobacter sp.]|jgi:hypothetical protein|nr:glycosyltransferase family 39 protein [Candidatus Sulfotelmatobacter sp.]